MLIKYHERNLIINSSAIEFYHDLKRILINERTVNNDTFKKYDYQQSQNEGAFLDRLITDSKKEWKIDKNFYEEDVKKKSICQLCGQRNLYKKYKIVNTTNAKFLIVGSSCIEKFGISNDQDLEDIRKNNIKLYRRRELDKYINIEKTIKEFDDIYKNSPVLIPLKYKKQHIELKESLKQIYDKMINKLQLSFDEEDMDDIRNLNTLLEYKNTHEKRILRYISSANKNNLMLPKKDLISFLRKEDIKLFFQIEKQGKITWQTGHKIKYEPWLNEVAIKLNDKLKKYHIQIDNVVFNSKYVLKYKQFRLNLYCNTEKLLGECGGLIFDSDRPLTEEDLLPDISELIQDMCEVGVNEYNADVIFNHMHVQINSFRFEDYFLEYGDAFYYSPKNKRYYQVDLKVIMDWYKCNMLFYENHRDFPKESLANIINNSPHLNKSDYEELKRRRERH